MKKTITLDFYKVTAADGENGLEEVLSVLATSPNDDLRNVELATVIFRLNRCAKHGARFEGEMMKIRMDDIPIRAKLSGETTDFDLEEDEGVGEPTAFLFDPRKNLLVLQRNRSGTTATKFAEYFNQCGIANCPITLTASLNSDAVKRMGKLKDISKFEFSITAPTDTGFLDSSNIAVRRAIKLARYFQSPTIAVTISRGHSPSFPAGDKIREVTEKLFGSGGNGVTKLRVTGPNVGDHSEVINFMLDQIREPATISYSDKRRTMPYLPRRNALREALDKWYKEL